ncbi:3-phosphoshikimate 1-carboxyvinyltransferase, partial [Patescibacteria group bacterium]|nr:3-phosphoshikimate 1-carboxyvinyltransferase [Patescibacteria group bacterium]
MQTREVIPLKQRPNWTVTLSGSKSITNRVFLCAALAKGKSRVYGALESDDTAVMLDALRKLKIQISNFKNRIEISGCGGVFKFGNVTVNAGASGTTTRFLTALAVLRKGKTIINGTKRMKERPMKDLTNALNKISNF